eukprot:gene27322-36077_t
MARIQKSVKAKKAASPTSTTSTSSFAKKSPVKSTPKQKATNSNFPWTEIIRNLRSKDDYRIEYYFTNDPNQEQRDFVAQSIAYFNPKTKRQTCPDAAAVTAALPQYVQGITANLTAATALAVTFKTLKHMVAMFEYIASVRNQHGNVTVCISVDGSPFFTVL